eukprot:CAMPEP_0118926784 /NCGR_PEP_ID=MMETSP1169-20130426/4402_1 /TAXON_ID=36882 /ORGANISM="Pyramimonas obovata, Strain CCMP722" /LENGTH=232 /DNA_ID=CAMNT_0006868409 /DNA_START=111 /DNA_END=809 /DNA_ORIENTATION=-
MTFRDALVSEVASFAGVPASAVAITSIADGSVLVDTTVTFDSASAAADFTSRLPGFASILSFTSAFETYGPITATETSTAPPPPLSEESISPTSAGQSTSSPPPNEPPSLSPPPAAPATSSPTMVPTTSAPTPPMTSAPTQNISSSDTGGTPTAEEGWFIGVMVGGAVAVVAIGAVVIYSVKSAAGAVTDSAALGGSSPLLPPLKVEVAHVYPDSPPPNSIGGVKVVPQPHV